MDVIMTNVKNLFNESLHPQRLRSIRSKRFFHSRLNSKYQSISPMGNLPNDIYYLLFQSLARDSLDDLLALAMCNRHLYGLFKAHQAELFRISIRNVARRHYFAPAIVLSGIEVLSVLVEEHRNERTCRHIIELLHAPFKPCQLTVLPGKISRAYHRVDSLLWLAWYGMYCRHLYHRDETDKYYGVWSDETWGGNVEDWIPIVFYFGLVNLTSMNEKETWAKSLKCDDVEDLENRFYEVSFGMGIFPKKILKAKFFNALKAFESKFNYQGHVFGELKAVVLRLWTTMRSYEETPAQDISVFYESPKMKPAVEELFSGLWVQQACNGNWNILVSLLRSDDRFEEFVYAQPAAHDIRRYVDDPKKHVQVHMESFKRDISRVLTKYLYET